MDDDANDRSTRLTADAIARAFVRGDDVRAIAAAAADADGTTDVDADALRRAHERSKARAQTMEGFDFNAGFDPASATFSFLRGRADGAAAGGETRRDANESDAREKRSGEDGTMDGGKERKRRRVEDASTREKRRERVSGRWKGRPAAARTSAASVMGVDAASGIDELARSWVATEEKEMLEKWREDVEGWRDDYKRKRRAALRLRKGTGATILA
ncbi:unnamed product [Ostreococcus tauri]|uniref:Unnamed product n=1 Tax=Ostreococcus tauri TaxID=70448 RepID=A0A090M5Q0_OSTTA|nr:unnamed product [Ostreococcus tauri]CEF97414.1 unnamed product [Ostreococcus tauri]|eukprot:XP_003078556.2 unnamed product [Ostreococcus tauri]